MKPLRATLAGSLDQPRGYPLPPKIGVGAGVENEGMYPAVPGEVDEAGEFFPLNGTASPATFDYFVYRPQHDPSDRYEVDSLLGKAG